MGPLEAVGDYVVEFVHKMQVSQKLAGGVTYADAPRTNSSSPSNRRRVLQISSMVRFPAFSLTLKDRLD